MTGDLYVQPSGVRSISQVHDQVVSSLSQLTAGGAEATGVQNSHGTIASAVSTALSGVLGTRNGTLQTTATSGSSISDKLRQAAKEYEQRDQEGAEKLKAAAAALDGISGGGQGAAPAGSPAASAAGGAPDAASSGGGAAGMMGQLAGQAGQVVGQVSQAMGGITQGLGQLPGQVMQGVSQIVGQATQAAQSGASGLGGPQGRVDNPPPTPGNGPADEKRPTGERYDEDAEEMEIAPAAEGAAAGADGAAAGADAAGAAPVEETPQQRPAPTRPQVD
jgi:Excreted virulence factor EspC, type VII ESX diderm